jgi:isopenicillin N synthase-like dioxygenase
MSQVKMNDIPLIEIDGLFSDELSEREAVAAEIGSACRKIGFFYMKTSTVSVESIESILQCSRDFFALPTEEKLELSMAIVGDNRGYIPLESEYLYSPEEPGDLKEGFHIAYPDRQGVEKSFRWPDIPTFKERVDSYFDLCLELGRVVHRGMALDLKLPENYFDARLDQNWAFLRLLHYPGLREPARPGQPGAGEHTDYGNITLLVTDGVSGLQVRRRDGVWIDAVSPPGCFIVNIADCLMRWTNDIYISTPHRVTIPHTDRYSVAFFVDANEDAVVEAIPSCIERGNTAKYPPIMVGDYFTDRFRAVHTHLMTAD